MEQNSPKADPMTTLTQTKEQARSSRIVRQYVRRRDAAGAALRLKPQRDGSVRVVRFKPGQRVQHMVLIISFIFLAITGLAQTYHTTPLGNSIVLLFGGIAALQSIHQVFAFIAGVLFIYHVVINVYELFVISRLNHIWFVPDDARNFIALLKWNFGVSKRYPRFDRYNFEEKITYWALIVWSIILGISGLILWFPVMVTTILPGWFIPVARSFHRWEAILAVLVVLTWHLYHTVLKTRNASIFTGTLSVEKMRKEHPLELLYLEAAAAVVQSEKWPALVEIQLNDVEEEAETTISPEKGTETPLEDQLDSTVAQTDTSLEKEINVPNGDSKITA